ncbi:MAG: SDR family NAD(P)-dependent oxidoreductase [Chlamydiales bacterium]|nr:SDR family NAD(P)-dependent oxidoreductase [Chlamydiia bacterium]MCP5507583.1 SDR family NAD(P)-dependent oxidoreductase [Chlamydiales bacterium]
MKFQLALVTGASSGIGEHLCRLLANKGINLIITARSADKLEKLAEELGEKVEVTIVPADLSDAKNRQKLIAKIHQESPDLIINNAGLGYYGSVLTRDTDEDLKVLEVNTAALLEISAEAARTLVTKGKKGVIMNVSSTAAFQILPGMATYAATKAFVNLFSESFDIELRQYGIRVLAACPGVVHTNFRKHASKGKSDNKKYLMTMSADFAANEIWKQIQSGKTIRAFDWKYRLMTFLSRYLTPKWLITKIGERLIRDLRSPQDIKKISL